MAITHNAVVVVADDGTSPVGSDEWNAAHTIEAGTVTVEDLAPAVLAGITGPYAIVAGSGATSAPNSAWTSASFGTTPALLTDPSGFYSASYPTRLTVPAGMGGLYQVMGCLRLAANAIGTQRMARVLLNAATSEVYASGVINAYGQSALNPTILLVLAAGDYLELQGWQDSGGSLDMVQQTPAYPRLSMCRLIKT